MAKTDSRTQIRPDLIKTPLHHLVVIKKNRYDCKETDREIKRLRRLHTAGENTGNKEKKEGWQFISEQDRPIFSYYLERLIFDFSSSD